MTDLLLRLQAALVERYAIERELGQGGMAVVFLGQDLKHRRAVAIKVLRPELAMALGAERSSARSRPSPASPTHTSRRSTIRARPRASFTTSWPGVASRSTRAP